METAQCLAPPAGSHGAGTLAAWIEPAFDETVDVVEALEQTRHHDIGRTRLRSDSAQRRGHGAPVPAVLVAQHPDQPELLGARRADGLLQPRAAARHDDRRLVEGEDFAERVVPAHRDHPGRTRHEVLEPRVERDRLDPIEPCDAHAELLPAPRPHERPEHDQGRMRQIRIRLVGAEDPVDEIFAVAAPAGGHEDERFGQRGRGPYPGRVVGRRALEIARVGHLLANRLRDSETRERIAYLRQAVDENVVVQGLERRHRVLSLPLLGEQGGIVHHVAQAQHEAGPARLERFQRALDLPSQAERFLVDDEDVGREHLGGVPDDGGPHPQHLPDVHVQAERGVLAVAQLDDARHADEVDPGAEIEAPDDRRARQDEHGQRLAARHQRVRDGPAPAQMPEPEGVVAVDQHPGVSG